MLHTFAKAIGKRTLFLTDAFPFLVIGVIERVVEEFIFVQVETCHVMELEGTTMRIYVDDIEVFYIEDEEHAIPSLKP
ncbi:MAG: hypothetical protein ACM3VX_07420 [Bacteroidota bacterium]